ncbi:MAG TPA: hypothetical protein VEO37_02395, partial [Thermoanaerobaculia bacterium]|nr:hypothetical protein [Thermoanaerobaculia bacterium]
VITLEDRDFILAAAAWTAQTDVSTIDVGLSPDEGLRRAPEFLRGLREGKISPADAPLDDASTDVLHAACRLLAEPKAGGVEDPLDSVRALYDFIEQITWLGSDFDERVELLGACAFAGWRIARPLAMPPITDQWQSRLFAATPEMLPLRNGTFADNAARNKFEINPQTKTDPIPPTETLLPLLEVLRTQWETDPKKVLEEALFLYQFLQGKESRYPMDAFLLDEREYFLGETARIAGNVCRALSLREEAYRWFDLADGWFRLTENASGNLSKVAYHRLALRLEERDFRSVEELLPQLIASFEKLGMTEDALKSRILEAGILKETDRLAEAAQAFREIAVVADGARLDSLLAHVHVNLAQIYSFLGEAENAKRQIVVATPLLKKLGFKMALAKLQWGVGYLERTQGNSPAAIEAYRMAQEQFLELGMRADVAAIQLVVADILLDEGQEKQAEWEIRQALPLIDEYKLVPEGFAAMTLLRESLRRQKIDRQALRNLHGYFEELQG